MADMMQSRLAHAARTESAAKEKPPEDKPPSYEEEEEGGYGCFGWYPRILQCCNGPKAALFWLSWFAFVQGFVVNGINNVNVSTFERRYELPSSRVGLISSAYDMSSLVLTLPLAYYGTHGHQPRMLAIGALFMSCGSFVMCIPQFAVGLYRLGVSVSDVCDVYGNSTVCREADVGLPNFLYVLMLGQALHGVGGTLLFSLGIVFLDSHVKHKDNPLYQGIFTGCAVLGPALGYVLGGLFLSIYVDFYRVDMSKLDVTPDDPRWVGAWWLGFAAAACLAITIFLGLAPFPRQLSNYEHVRKYQKSEAHHDGSEAIAQTDTFARSIRDFPKAMKILLCNPTNVFLNLAGASEALVVSGFATFMPKFIQSQYGQSTGMSAVLGGVMAVPGAAGGQVIGGLLVRGLRLKVRGNLKLIIFLSFTAVAIIGLLSLLHCPDAVMAGINTVYENKSVPWGDRPPNLTATCNAYCNCDTGSYEPVCGVDRVQYFSACHAGCHSSFGQQRNKKFGNCSCVVAQNWTAGTVMAQSGACPSDCNTLPIYVAMFFFVILCTFMMIVPSIVVTLRCVPENARALNMGFRTFIGRAIGSIPGPIIFGAIFDSTCIVWQEDKCKTEGSCWVYHRWDLRVQIIVIGITVKLITAVFTILALIFYKPPPEEVEEIKVSIDGVVNQGFHHDEVVPGTRYVAYVPPKLKKEQEWTQTHEDTRL